MKHLFSAKAIAAVALALGAISAVSSVHAASNVNLSIGMQVPGFYAHAAPRYVRPVPVYSRPPVPYGRVSDGRSYGAQPWQRRGFYADLDRDGILNRNDRDRDGDGVLNRYDRLPDNPYRS